MAANANQNSDFNPMVKKAVVELEIENTVVVITIIIFLTEKIGLVIRVPPVFFHKQPHLKTTN
ncbi:hypothetical protein RyT2_08550 [Pseudolactococcus yaeyamensis]